MMNLADPELELIDPTPNVHTLFLHFDQLFFWTKLGNRAVVRWSKRMYSCAGICSYEGRGGLCDIALSEPLLKLRPRKDLIETLIHEMIHAFLFITCRDRERDGHGPNFQSHMHRINRAAGLNISIYHDFHDEVQLYQTHWWRCNGPCQTRKPYFGIVRKSCNKAPGPKDFWWCNHQKLCGGTFMKIKEPEPKTKKSTAKQKNTKGDITKYINNNNNNTLDKNIRTINNLPNRKPLTPIQTGSKVPTGTLKTNGKTIVISPKAVISSPKAVISNPKDKSIVTFSGKGQALDGSRKRSNSVDVAETVRDVWAKKFANTNSGKGKEPVKRNNTIIGSSNTKTSKYKIPAEVTSPPTKIMKIDDYFKSTANLLKDIYGQEFNISESDNKIKVAAVTNQSNDNKLKVANKLVVSNQSDSKLNVAVNNLVPCPICNMKVDSTEINRHLDECLNKDIIQELSQTTNNTEPTADQERNSGRTSPIYKVKTETGSSNANVTIDLTNIQFGIIKEINEPIKKVDVNKVIVNTDLRKSDSFVPKDVIDSDLAGPSKPYRKSFDFVPKHEPDEPAFIDVPTVKIEPGTSKDIQKCPCCGANVDKTMAEHLDECLSFFDNNTTIPEEGASSSFNNSTIVIDDDDDDVFDETQTMNATGTKTPCPCCMMMIESDDMNNHLDDCLS